MPGTMRVFGAPFLFYLISVSLTVSIDIGTEQKRKSFFTSSTRLAPPKEHRRRTKLCIAFSSYATEIRLQVRDSPELR